MWKEWIQFFKYAVHFGKGKHIVNSKEQPSQIGCLNIEINLEELWSVKKQIIC
jgi:hypothetical protein